MSSREFGFKTTADEVLEGIDLRGRVAVVTGASGGLGAETARALASKAADVTLGCRDAERGECVAADIRRATGNDAVRADALDLLDRASIRTFAQRFLARHPQLHMLINNAGVMACPFARSPEGWEVQFATNHVGHFLLTNLLMPALVRGAPARVISVSSAGHMRSSVDFEDLHWERKPYDKWMAYGQSKTANALFAVGLDRRFRGKGVRALALHPGAIATDLSRHLSAEDLGPLIERISTLAGGLKEVPAGAATSVWAATAPELEGEGGIYLEDCRRSAPVGTAGITTGYLPHALDAELAERLWRVSEELVGQRFG
jgi:NAD(P)-dependent dehydrogenase (short-subunit alcohol dehydrogenase family)